MAKRQKSSSNLLEVQNAAKTMFANIRFQSIDEPIRMLALTSSVPDEGKTTTVWYLAQAAATAGNKVLIVEADMRRRSLAAMLQLHPQHGLFSVLSGNARLEQAVVATSVANLHFLDAESGIPNPPDVLASKRMGELCEVLRSNYDYVIFDTPPVGTFVDAAVLSTLVDGVILVVRPGVPKRTELQMAYSQLTNADANVIGLCSTFVEGTGSEYYYSYYTKGGRSRRGDEKQLDFVAEGSTAASAATRSIETASRPMTSKAAPGSASGPQAVAAKASPGKVGTAKATAPKAGASKANAAVKPSGAKAPSGARGGISVPRSTPVRQIQPNRSNQSNRTNQPAAHSPRRNGK